MGFKYLRELLLVVVYVLGSLGIVASGGGGGGGGGSSDDGEEITYVGNTAAATMSSDNAARLVSNIFVGNTIVDVSSGYKARLEITADGSSSQPGLSRFPGRLSKRLRDAIHPAISLLRGKMSVQARTDVDDTLPCDSGSIKVTGYIEDDFSGLLTLDFRNCREGNETLEGKVTSRIFIFDIFLLVPIDADYTFKTLILTTPDYSLSVSGSIRSRLFTGQSGQGETLTIDRLVSRNNSTGEMLMIRNQVNQLDYDNFMFPTMVSETVTGRIYDSIHGYVDYSTVSPLVFNTLIQKFPDSGQISIVGDLNAEILVTVISNTNTMLSFDLDADLSFEASVNLDWLEIDEEPDLTDSDGDGIHDSWEENNGLDSSNASDAILDNDGDGFNNLEEYLGGSDINDNGSTPPVADLSIIVTLPDDPVAGSSFLYLLQVQNDGPLTASDVIVTNELPEGAILENYFAPGWSCNQEGKTISCTRSSASLGVGSSISLTVILPLTPGPIVNTTWVAAATPDIEPSNNYHAETTVAVVPASSKNLIFDVSAFDMELDTARQRVYVSVPDKNAIEIISLNNLTNINSIVVGSSPLGIALDPDGNILYAALNQGGAIATVDLDTLSVSEINVAPELGTHLAYDVIAPTPNEVFVSGNPGSSGSAYIVRIDTANAYQVTRVASDRIIRSDPVFAARPSPQYLYVTQGFSPGSVYKLDLNQTTAPIILEDARGSISSNANKHVAIDSNGTQLYLASGQVLDSNTLTEVGLVPSGISKVSGDDLTVLVGDIGNTVGVFDTSNFQLSERIYTACTLNQINRIIEAQAGTEWILLGEDSICQITAASGSDPVPAVSDLFMNTAAILGDPVVDEFYRYNVTVFNQGPMPARNVSIVNNLPPAATVFNVGGGSWTCNQTGDVVSCTRNEIDAGASTIIQISIRLPSAPGSITNSASVSSDTADPDLSNNSDSFIVNVDSRAPSINLDLGADVFDIELDTARQRIYVSIPTLNTIEVISLGSFTVSSSIPVGTSPHGIDMSPDGSTLFVALNQTGAVAVVDLETFGVSEIDVSTALGTLRVFDVISPTTDEIFVSGNPRATGLSYIVKVDTANANQVTRVASDRVTRDDPFFAAKANPQFLYVGEGSSSDNLLKLDLAQASAPIILEQGIAFIEKGVDINADGSLLFLDSGRIFRTDTLTSKGLIGMGIPTVSGDGTSVAVGESPNSVGIYDTSTQLKLDTVYTSCNLTDVGQIVEIQSGSKWILMGQQTVCEVSIP